MISRQLKPNWSDKHKQYMKRAIHATISVAEGAVRAGKTVDNVAAFARMLDLGVKDRIHLATGSTLANAKLNIGDCNGFGLEHIFRGRCRWTKYKGNEALQIEASGRKYVVIFAGAAKADSFKKIRGNSYGMWIATEINLHHNNTIKEAFNRQLAAKTRRIFWDLNPSSPASWIYKEYIDRFTESFGELYNYEHFTIRDNANISEKRLAEIEAQYDKGSIWYRRDILGQRCDVEGIVYDMFSMEKHVLHVIPELGPECFVSSDFGIQNATTFLIWRKIKNTKAWLCVRYYYYSGRESHKQKTVSELVRGLKETLAADDKPKYIIVDPSAAALITELRANGFKTRHANNDVINGINDVGSMLRQDLLYFMDCCEKVVEEFGLYCWDTTAAEKGEDKPLKENDHCMDAVRYFVYTEKLVTKAESQSEDLLFL